MSFAAGLVYTEARKTYAEFIVRYASSTALVLYEAGYPLAAQMAWQHVEVHMAQLIWTAEQEVTEDMLPLYVSLIWEMLPLLQGRTSSQNLQGARTCLVSVPRMILYVM